MVCSAPFNILSQLPENQPQLAMPPISVAAPPITMTLAIVAVNERYRVLDGIVTSLLAIPSRIPSLISFVELYPEGSTEVCDFFSQ